MNQDTMANQDNMNLKNQNNSADIVASNAKAYFNEFGNKGHGREHSWEACYSTFLKEANSNIHDYDLLSLHLAFFLASWGMYRGSSFLLQEDYRVHLPVVKMFLREKYRYLQGIECTKLIEPKVCDDIIELKRNIGCYYEKIREMQKIHMSNHQCQIH